ncbi:PhzF family phenazine biosynthesis protein [uncultured Veillonella sp.]|uniref:PhzF family phenazine biosynthesis protein n=1 Tax=uncultured Veillonella sp. TaxID=159268 RepID=UPI002605B17D|nr:PhzF family phenazine biosynthesis protein [uncultured Veillonella sp.]
MKQYIVDAFTDTIFHGNPAAVCILDEWLSEDMMLNIAKENNLSETAFAVKEGRNYRLRWFTPSAEIDLCGHATLGTSYVLMNFYDKDAPQITFDTLSGPLVVERKGSLYEMDFPAYSLTQVEVTDAMEKALGVRPVEAYMGRDLLCVLPLPEMVVDLSPDLEKIKELDGLLCHVTAKTELLDLLNKSADSLANKSADSLVNELDDSLVNGSIDSLVNESIGSSANDLTGNSTNDLEFNKRKAPHEAGGKMMPLQEGVDCVSRSFAPKLAVPEDPVCGSGHCHIVPYWAEKLGKSQITAYQASPRGGTLYCRMEGDRVKLAGQVALYATAELHIK